MQFPRYRCRPDTLRTREIEVAERRREHKLIHRDATARAVDLKDFFVLARLRANAYRCTLTSDERDQYIPGEDK